MLACHCSKRRKIEKEEQKKRKKNEIEEEEKRIKRTKWDKESQMERWAIVEGAPEGFSAGSRTSSCIPTTKITPTGWGGTSHRLISSVRYRSCRKS